MKCVGLLALLISIQWVSQFIQQYPSEVNVNATDREFVNNADHKTLNVEENDYVEGTDINPISEPQNINSHPATNAQPQHTSTTLSTTQTYVADDIDLSTESTTEPYFFENLVDLLSGSSEVLGNISESTFGSVASITSSLDAVSTTSFDMLTKVADRINLVYRGLSRVTGPQVVILMILIDSLPHIFNAITSAVSELEAGIGVEASDAMKDYIAGVQLSLKNLLFLLNGSVEENVDILQIVQEIAKTVQYVASSVISISLAISEAIDSVAKTIVEAVISLQLIFSAVVYVTQWVLSLGVSIFYSLIGSVSEVMSILSQLTIAISHTFENVSKVCSNISMINSDSLENILVKIIPLIQDLKQLLTLSYTPISGNVVNIVFNIDQILTDTPKPNENPAAELKHDTTGTVPEILRKLTGKLISISSELSSSLFSLNNSLKIGSNFGTTTLTAISNILSMILTRFTAVNGTASEILTLISDLLDETFRHLSHLVAKFSALGDVSKTLNAAVSNIHDALRSLIDSINVSNVATSIVDPIKDVAKTCQILVSSLSAIFEAVGLANQNISNKLSEVITYLPHIVSTIIVVVQYVIGASIAKVQVKFGKLPANLQELASALSTILQRITSITANITIAQSGIDVNYNEIMSNILSPVSELNLLASTSLSVISEILANVKVSFDAGKNIVQ